jgi:hypothetical protein
MMLTARSSENTLNATIGASNRIKNVVASLALKEGISLEADETKPPAWGPGYSFS